MIADFPMEIHQNPLRSSGGVDTRQGDSNNTQAAYFDFQELK